MTLRLLVLGHEVARLDIIQPDRPSLPGVPEPPKLMDAVADYFTNRFVRRKLL